MTGPFVRIEDIADAVMYEGYVLYPYRASAMKNRCRWQFGVVAPRGAAAGDPAHTQTECLVESEGRPTVIVKARCLQLQRRTVEEPLDSGWRSCERLVVDGRELLTWDEARLREVESPALDVSVLSARAYVMPFDLEPGQESEIVCGSDGVQAARITRECRAVSARVVVSAEPVGAFLKIRVRVENTTPFNQSADGRDAALPHSLLGCHALLHVQGGRFVSLIDPPEAARTAVQSCVNEHTWPVLAGSAGSRDLLLSAPIILYDYPSVAGESRDRFFDATEIDEMLALRVMTMTDDEKRQAAATDANAAAIVERTADRADAALHGAIRSFEELLNADAPASEADPGRATSIAFSIGSRVRLEPQRRGDSMDMFLAGRIATICGLHRDLEDRLYLAVTIDGDPGADLHEAYGRFFYFFPEEVRIVDADNHVVR